MRTTIKHLRIALAQIFLSIGHKIDCRDIEDMKAELKRIDPNYDKCSTPILLSNEKKG